MDPFGRLRGPALFLAAHTDDIELGAGGTVSRLVREGFEVHCVAFSRCEASLRPGLPPDTLELEMKRAVQELGVQADQMRVFDLPVRHFPEHRQRVLDGMLDLKRELQPDLVFAPTTNDVHQDHQTVASEALRAFKTTTTLTYEMPWNSFHFRTSTYIRLADEDLERKVLAVQQYVSQQSRPYADPEYLRSHCVMRGMQCGSRLAEAFDLIRWVL